MIKISGNVGNHGNHGNAGKEGGPFFQHILGLLDIHFFSPKMTPYLKSLLPLFHQRGLKTRQLAKLPSLPDLPKIFRKAGQPVISKIKELYCSIFVIFQDTSNLKESLRSLKKLSLAVGLMEVLK